MRIFLALALIIFCAIKAYEYFYKDDDSDNLINLLQQPKNIKSRDFTSLFSHVNNRIENVARQTDTQTIQEPQESKEELKEQTPLMLGAILNNSALINNVWYKKGDIINNSNSNFIMVTPPHSASLSNNVKLMLPLPCGSMVVSPSKSGGFKKLITIFCSKVFSYVDVTVYFPSLQAMQQHKMLANTLNLMPFFFIYFK